jgi:hypothetical protein
MSVSGIRNRLSGAGVRTKAVDQTDTAKGHTGKPALPCDNTEEPQRAEGTTRKCATYSISIESYLLNTGSFPRDAKADGK